MQDWVAASDLVSCSAYTGYVNNAPSVHVNTEGGFSNFVKIRQAFLKNKKNCKKRNSSPPKSHQYIPMRPEGDLNSQPQIQLKIPHQPHLTGSQEPTLFYDIIGQHIPVSLVKTVPNAFPDKRQTWRPLCAASAPLPSCARCVW